MAFPAGWGWRALLTIPAGQVSAVLAGFPVLLTPANLPSQMLDADGAGPALSGGGDVRFSSDAAGATQLPCEVVSLVPQNDPATATAQLWVQLPSISNVADTTFYVWWGYPGETQPAASDPYGSQAVWDASFQAVYHLEEDPSGAAPQVLDSTATGAHLTAGGAMTAGDLVAGKVGSGIDLDHADDLLSNGSALDNLAALTISAQMKPSSGYGSNTRNVAGKHWSFSIDSGAETILFTVPHATTMLQRQSIFASVTMNAWAHLAVTWDGSTTAANAHEYVNGAEVGMYITTTNGAGARSDDAAFDVTVGNRSGGGAYGFGGILDEVRISNAVRSVAWLLAETNGMNAPASFVTAGAPAQMAVSYFPPVFALALATLAPDRSPHAFTPGAFALPLGFDARQFAMPAFALPLAAISPKGAAAPKPGTIALPLGITTPGGKVMVEVTSTLGLALALKRPTWAWDIPTGARAQAIYRCYLTGAADGTTDVELPATSFQARLRTGEPSYLSVVVPDAPTYLPAITARPNGELVVKRGIRWPTGVEILEEIARVGLERIADDRGAGSYTLTLSGHKTQTTATPKTRTLAGLSYRHAGTGARRYRCSLDTFLRPGDTVYVPEYGESAVVRLITYVIDGRTEMMELTEAE